MYQLREDQQVQASFSVTDSQGNPALIDGTPEVVSSDESILTAILENDGVTVTIVPTGVLGSAQVQISADADLGAGVETISGVFDVEVVAGKAVSISLNPGTPTDRS
jgi:hypothetical protein